MAIAIGAATGCTHAMSAPPPEPAPRRGFMVLVAEHDRDQMKKMSVAELGPPILAISSTDPTNASEQSLGTSDGHYSIKVHWRPKGAEATRAPCLDVMVSRRERHPLPDADMHGCIVPSDGDTWLGQVSSDAGKSFGVVVSFSPILKRAGDVKLSTVAARSP